MLSYENYFGSKINKENEENLLESESNVGISDLFFAYNKFGYYPCSLNLGTDYQEYFSIKKIFDILKNDYNHLPSNDIKKIVYSSKYKGKFIDSSIIELNENIVLSFSYGVLEKDINQSKKDETDDNNEFLGSFIRSITVYFGQNKFEDAKKISEKIMKTVENFETEASLNMVCKNQHGFYLTDIKIKEPSIKDLKINYGDDFEAIHEKILKGLEKKEGSGIVLLHGEPGTGKTHYIRYLIQKIKDKKLIYVPPDLATSIASPEFLPFMLQNKDSILIIEDAENIIKDRIESGQTTQAVANILNLSDGLLGDSLHQPIIATFNCEVSKIDSALLRNGRLIAAHDFKKLNTEQAQKLSNELGFNTKITQPMTLADIYAQQK